MYNEGGISENDPLPKFWSEKSTLAQERLKIAEGLKDKATWHTYHKKLPLGHTPLAQNLPEKHVKKEKTPFLIKDQWESAYTELARTINETSVLGKPPVEKYFKRMKPENKE